MNSVEKTKIEKIITAEVEERIEELKARRNQKFGELKEKAEKTPSSEVLSVRKDIRENKEKLEELEKELAELGYKLTYSNDLELSQSWRHENGVGFYEYSVSELTEHSKETADKVRALKKLSRLYQLKLYAGTEEEQQEVLQFVNDFDSAIESEMSKL